MLQVNFTTFPTLETERLILRDISINDAPEIYFLRSDATVLTYLDKKPDDSEAVSIEWIRMVKKNQEDNNSILWGITEKGNNRLIGTISFWRLIKEHYRAEIGYVLHPDYYGKGIMPEAMKAVLNYGFEKMQLHSVEANVNPANTGSIKALEKNGFVREAYFRENYYHDGKFLDSAIYSLVTPLC